jgi:hypothetical protein
MLGSSSIAWHHVQSIACRSVKFPYEYVLVSWQFMHCSKTEVDVYALSSQVMSAPESPVGTLPQSKSHGDPVGTNIAPPSGASALTTRPTFQLSMVMSPSKSDVWPPATVNRKVSTISSSSRGQTELGLTSGVWENDDRVEPIGCPSCAA